MNYFSFLLILLFSFSFKRDEADLEMMANNKLEFVSENLKNILFQLKSGQKIDILHLGDSHVQIGEFSKGILNGLMEKGISCNKGWFLPSLIFTELYSNRELKRIKGKFTAENIRNNPHLLAGVSGRTFSTLEENFSFKFSFDEKISSFQILHEDFAFDKISCSKGGKIINEVNKTSNLLSVSFARKVKSCRIKFNTTNKEQKDFFAMKAIKHGEENTTSYSNFGVSGAQFSDFYYAMRIYDHIELLKPQLIIITLGTNDSYFKDLNKNTFPRKLTLFIRKIKEISPKTALIFMTAPDTFYQNEKPSHLKFVNESIISVCSQEQVALWDWNKIMGGENSIHSFAQKKMVDSDLLHFNSAGYKFFGNLFIQAIFAESVN
jgi:lysophospholipase L1-like esterase